MSLLKDILDILQYVLEYFGVPADMLCAVSGRHRSIVRMIGSYLPLDPCARVYVQLPLLRREEMWPEGPVIPSLADVLWVSEDGGNAPSQLRNCIRPHTRAVAAPPEGAALRKISALEGELLRLRAQIAQIVATPTGSDVSQPTFLFSPPLPPPLSSTPVAPPPPPPPLPCPPVSIQPHKMENKSERTEASGGPSMLDVLKEMNHVKLRTVERSPGGTPVRKKRRSRHMAAPSDPAAIIAEALRKKFAHSHSNDSFDKENRSLELSPFGSPEPSCSPHPGRREPVR